MAAFARRTRRPQNRAGWRCRLEPRGGILAQGRIAGCSQSSGRLLILALAGASGRSRALLIATGTLPAGAFCELAVPGGRAARV
jgi:hypothetical protein